jgi:hypothetical protein
LNPVPQQIECENSQQTEPQQAPTQQPKFAPLPQQLRPDGQQCASQHVPPVHKLPFPLGGLEQVPPLQVPMSWHSLNAVQTTFEPAVHVPFWHVSLSVQALPSLHGAPFALFGLEQMPVPGSHTPASWHWSSAEQTTGLDPIHVPLWQVSVCVQALPSLQEVPFDLFGFEQTPVVVSHVPALWHWSSGVQTTGVPAEHEPFWQVFPVVQALLSLQDTPLAFAGFEQVPVSGLQVPASWHWSDAVQTTGLLPTQTPPWQVSVCVQALLSLHTAPFALAG